MANVCVGPEFDVDDDGRLRLRLCGEPVEQAWPYACPPSSANPVRVSPDCGLWVPPYARAARAAATGETSSSQKAVPAGFTVAENAEITIANPSPCYAAQVMLWIQADVDFYLPAGTDSRAAYSINGNSMMAIENPAPGTGTEMTGVHWDLMQPIASGTIAAGGSNSFTFPIEVGSGQGGAQYGQIRWQIRALVLAGL